MIDHCCHYFSVKSSLELPSESKSFSSCLAKLTRTWIACHHMWITLELVVDVQDSEGSGGGSVSESAGVGSSLDCKYHVNSIPSDICCEGEGGEASCGRSWHHRLLGR